MKKMLSILMILLFLTTYKIFSLEIGVGYTADVGLHLRISKFEFQTLFDKDFMVYGLRYCPITKNLNLFQQDWSLYVGVEGDYINSELLKYGYTGGIFSGLDKKLYKSLHLGIDLGIYYTHLKGPDGWEDFSDFGMAINTKLTWYFNILKK